MNSKCDREVGFLLKRVVDFDGNFPKAFKEVKPVGVIRVNTTAILDAHGEPLEEPVVLGLIDIDGTDGSMLGRIKTKKLGADLSGKKVKAVLRPKKEREGTMKDILHYEIV